MTSHTHTTFPSGAPRGLRGRRGIVITAVATLLAVTVTVAASSGGSTVAPVGEVGGPSVERSFERVPGYVVDPTSGYYDPITSTWVGPVPTDGS